MQEPDASSQIVSLPVKKGDVTIHEEHIVHGSPGNLSESPRKTVVMAFRDDIYNFRSTEVIWATKSTRTGEFDIE